MNIKQEEFSETTEITCPNCKGTLVVSPACQSIPCRHCNQHVNVKEIFHPTEKRKTITIGKRTLTCYKCQREITTDKNAQATTCKHCYHRNDLSDYKIKSLFGKIMQTHGTLYLKRKGAIDISKVQVGNALIKGKLSGDIQALDTVEILKHGHVNGAITCRKLIVKKGGIFSGKVQMLGGK